VGDVVSVIFDVKKKKLMFEKNGKRIKTDLNNVDTSVELSPAVCMTFNELEVKEFKILESYD
jgi:hypothetical protein